MSADPTDPPGRSPLDPDAEKLFGFGSEAWTSRLRSAHQAKAPARLGPYEILGELGRGGQGEVYRAVQPGTGRIVALKRIAGLGLSPDPSLLIRFTCEVEALTRLSHPNVVAVHTIDTAESHTVLIMELVEGRSIDLWADAQWAAAPSPFRTILLTFTQVCDGVSHAHQRGVIHRDIKPSNILVNSHNQPKVLDFGIARLLNEQAAAGAQAVWTLSGFAGTPAYASPEQLNPRDSGGVDTRSDVYSLGILLFRMLTGEEAFDPTLGLAFRLKSAEDGPIRPPSRVRPCLSAECDWIVRKATEPEPDRRYPTVDALADDVRRLLDGRPVLAHPPSAWYSAKRTLQRHPRISSGIAAATIAVSTLAIVTGVQAVRLSARSKALTEALLAATREKERAERGELRQKSLNQRVLQTVGGSARDTRLYTSTDTGPIQVLTALAKQLGPDDDDNTTTEVRLRLGILLFQTGRRPEAEVQLSAAQITSDRIDDPTDERAVRLAVHRARNLNLSKKHDLALAVIDRAIERAATGPRTVHVTSLWWERAAALTGLNRPVPELIACAQEWFARCDEHPELPALRAGVREEIAYNLIRRADYKTAESYLRDAMKICAAGGVPANTTSRIQHALGSVLLRDCQWPEIEGLARAASDFRIKTESASTSRAHKFTQLHALSLLGLGRYQESIARWELAAVRPLSRGNPADMDLAVVRTGWAAALYGSGQTARARETLALAVSRGKHSDPAHPAVASAISKVESALRAQEWVICQGLRDTLGDQAWLVQGLVFGETSEDTPDSRE